MESHDWLRRIKRDSALSIVLIVLTLIALAVALWWRVMLVADQTKWSTLVEEAPQAVSAAADAGKEAERVLLLAQAVDYSGAQVEQTQNLMPEVDSLAKQLDGLVEYLTLKPLEGGSSKFAEVDPYSSEDDANVEVIVDIPRGFRDLTVQYTAVQAELDERVDALATVTEDLAEAVEEQSN